MLVPCGERKMDCMSADDVSGSVEKERESGVAWVAVFRWSGIFLLRLLIGSAIWVVLMALGIILQLPLLPVPFGLDESRAEYLVVLLSLPILGITSLVFLPLWKELEKGDIRGCAGAITATKNLLLPAIVLQFLAALGGSIGLGVVNFLIAIGICFLVTLALDEERGRQFLQLIVAGAHGILLCIAAFTMDPNTPVDGWQLKAVSWVGAIPPIILMWLLFIRCREALLKLPQNRSAVIEGAIGK